MNHFPLLVLRPRASAVRITIVFGRSIEKDAFKQAINNGINPIETAADVKRARIAALSNEQIDNPIHTIPSKDERANYGIYANIMMMIGKTKIKDLIPEKVDHIYADCTQAEVQKQMEGTLVDML